MIRLPSEPGRNDNRVLKAVQTLIGRLQLEADSDNANPWCMRVLNTCHRLARELNSRGRSDREGVRALRTAVTAT